MRDVPLPRLKSLVRFIYCGQTEALDEEEREQFLRLARNVGVMGDEELFKLPRTPPGKKRKHRGGEEEEDKENSARSPLKHAASEPTGLVDSGSAVEERRRMQLQQLKRRKRLQARSLDEMGQPRRVRRPLSETQSLASASPKSSGSEMKALAGESLLRREESSTPSTPGEGGRSRTMTGCTTYSTTRTSIVGSIIY